MQWSVLGQTKTDCDHLSNHQVRHIIYQLCHSVKFLHECRFSEFVSYTFVRRLWDFADVSSHMIYSQGWHTPTWSQRTSCSPPPIGRFRTTLESARTFEKSKAQRWEKLRYYNVSSKSLRCAWLTLGRPPLTGNTTARWCLQDTTGSFVILSHRFKFQSFLWPTNLTLQTWWSPGHPKSSWSWVGHNHVTFGA